MSKKNLRVLLVLFSLMAIMASSAHAAPPFPEEKENVQTPEPPRLTPFGEKTYAIASTLNWEVILAPENVGGLYVNENLDRFSDFHGPIVRRCSSFYLVEVVWFGKGVPSGEGFMVVEALLPEPDRAITQEEVAELFGFKLPPPEPVGYPGEFLARPGTQYTLPVRWWILSLEELVQLQKLDFIAIKKAAG